LGAAKSKSGPLGAEPQGHSLLAKKRRTRSSKSPSGETSQSAHPNAREPYKAHLRGPWLDAFRKTGTIFAACNIVAVARRTIQEWRKTDPEFEAAFIEAETETTERVETSALQRAIHGDREPVIRNGIVQTDTAGNPLTIRTFSDKLQTFFLERRNQARYGVRIKQDIDITFVGAFTDELLNELRPVLPEICPGCKTRLDMPERVAQALLRVSAKMDTANR
jgi:hypothetical protein